MIDLKRDFDILFCLAVAMAMLAWATWYFVLGGWPCL